MAHPDRPLLLTLLAAVLLTACGGKLNVWPFDKGQDVARSGPANATEYLCGGNKRLYVRHDDAGAWVIFPDREVRLDKVAGSNRYSRGNTGLEFKEGEAVFTDGTQTFSGCKENIKGR